MKPKHLLSPTASENKPQNVKVATVHLDPKSLREDIRRVQEKARERIKKHVVKKKMLSEFYSFLLPFLSQSFWQKKWVRGTLALLAVLFCVQFVLAYRSTSLYQEAASYHQNKSYRKAVKKYSQFIDRFPEHKSLTDALYYRASSYALMGKETIAIKEYESLIEKYPASQKASYAYYALASLLSQNGSLEKATHLFQVALNEYPESSIVIDLWRGLAQSHQKNRRFEAAIAAYKNTLRASRGLTTGFEHFQMGLCYLGLSNNEAAKEMFRHVEHNKIAEPEYAKQALLKRLEINQTGFKAQRRSLETAEPEPEPELEPVEIKEPQIVSLDSARIEDVEQRMNLRRIKGAEQSVVNHQTLEELREELELAKKTFAGFSFNANTVQNDQENISLESLENNLQAL